MIRIDRINQLSVEIPNEPWNARRDADGNIIIWAGNEPILQILYGGSDLAKYLVEVSPARLLRDI